jgi:hypothetical protein
MADITDTGGSGESSSRIPNWPTMKQQFETRYNKINSYVQNKLKGDSQQLATAVANYVKSGGASSGGGDAGGDADASGGLYGNIVELSTRINNHKKAMANLNKEMADTLHNLSAGTDMGAILLENGQLQQEIIRLEKEQDSIEDDVETAKERSHLFRTQATAVNKRQIFFLGRPLRPGIIPWLWSLSILFLGVGLLLLYYGMLGSFGVSTLFGPSTSDPLSYMNSGQSFTGKLWSILSSPAVWGTLLGSTVIVILFLSLKIAGYFG